MFELLKKKKVIFLLLNIFKKDKKDTHYRYGAWYLPKEHWKLMPQHEKLTDPKLVKESEKNESKKKSEEIVNIIIIFVFFCIKLF